MMRSSWGSWDDNVRFYLKKRVWKSLSLTLTNGSRTPSPPLLLLTFWLLLFASIFSSFLSSNTPLVNLKTTTWSLLEREIVEEMFQSCIEFVGQLVVCSWSALQVVRVTLKVKHKFSSSIWRQTHTKQTNSDWALYMDMSLPDLIIWSPICSIDVCLLNSFYSFYSIETRCLRL